MKLAVHNLAGEEIDSIEADDLVFGLPPHAASIRQAMLAQLANRRSGSAKTKTRGEVAGSTRKIRRQKGLGGSRQGSIRAPHHRHGGIVFGPKPRSFAQDLPKRIRRLAIRSALSARAQEGALMVIDKFELSAPHTRTMADLMAALGLERSALVVTGTPDRNVFLSTRNLSGSKALVADYLNVVDVIQHHALVMTVDAVRRAEALWGGERAGQRLPVAAKEGANNG
jgi:large subunit ribosomal protein L4